MPQIIRDLLMLFLGSGIGAIGNHYLGRDSARTDRLRSARVRVRGWLDQIDAAHPSYIYQDHERICPEVGAMRKALVDDLRFWSRASFIRACDVFLATTDDELRPVVTPGFSMTPRSDEEKKREKENWIKPRNLLHERLNAILNRI